MQALSCGSPSTMAASVAAPADDGFTMPEVEKSEVAKPGTDRLNNKIRLSTTRPDIGTPSRIPKDSNGQRLCLTPRIARPAGVMKSTIGSQTPKTVRASGGMRNIRASSTPKKIMQPIAVETENHAPSSEEEESRDTPLEAFTIYANPSFEPLVLETAGSSPIKEQKQVETYNVIRLSEEHPSCVPVDSNGQKLCPTPRRTPSFNSPGVARLRVPKPTAFQPLETIQSPVVPKEQQARGGVLTDSNGQWTLETPKQRASPFITASSAENLTPRALFNDPHGPAGATPRSMPQTRSATKARPGSTPTAKNPLGSKPKKRTRAGDDEDEENARVTRSKREAEKIAQFLRSPAARVRPDGRREEYWQGVSDVLVEKYAERSAVKVKSAAP